MPIGCRYAVWMWVGAALALPGSAQRLRPPKTLECPRDKLTSFTGNVTRYTRAADRVSLSIRTDEDTHERFTLKVGKSKSAASLFLMNGEPFVEKDWVKVEASKGRLLPRMRATVWVCEGGANPVVDWRPPRE